MNKNVRKGISPIIATVLLIAITIAAGLAIYGWVSGLIGAGTSSRVTGATPLSITVVNAAYNAASSGQDSVVLTITNGGSHDVTLQNTNIEIVSSSGNAVSTASITFGSSSTGSHSVTISAGSTTTVTVTFQGGTGTYTLSIVGATDAAGNTVIANSVSFNIQ